MQHVPNEIHYKITQYLKPSEYAKLAQSSSDLRIQSNQYVPKYGEICIEPTAIELYNWFRNPHRFIDSFTLTDKIDTHDMIVRTTVRRYNKEQVVAFDREEVNRKKGPNRSSRIKFNLDDRESIVSALEKYKLVDGTNEYKIIHEILQQRGQLKHNYNVNKCFADLIRKRLSTGSIGPVVAPALIPLLDEQDEAYYANELYTYTDDSLMIAVEILDKIEQY